MLITLIYKRPAFDFPRLGGDKLGFADGAVCYQRVTLDS
jgi:hypothetical protein